MGASHKKWRRPGLQCLVFAGLFLAATGVARAQTYNFSAPVSGYQEVPFADPNNPNYGPFSPGRYPGFSWNVDFSSVTGTLTYDSSAGTMDMSGTISIGSSAYNGSFSDDQNVNGNQVSATVNVNSSVVNANNNSMAFDSGVVQHMNGQNNQWEISMQVPISGTYSLVTGGQTYNGSFTETLSLATLLNLQSANENTLTFSQDNPSGTESGGATLAQVNAANGVQLTLASLDPSDGQTYASWQMNNVNATTPEPKDWVLFTCGLIALYFARRFSNNAPIIRLARHVLAGRKRD